jgi:hypothetical protein
VTLTYKELFAGEIKANYPSSKGLLLDQSAKSGTN